MQIPPALPVVQGPPRAGFFIPGGRLLDQDDRYRLTAAATVAWVLLVVGLVVVFGMAGCAQVRPCATIAEQIHAVGVDGTGARYQVRAFTERCPASA